MSSPALPPRLVQIDFIDMPPEVPPRPHATDVSRREQCMAIRKGLVKKISYTIDSIAEKVKCYNISLTLSSIVVLSLHLPIYIEAHQDINSDLELGIDHIVGTYSFYLMFPLMGESILVEGTRSDDIEI
jgi:hypothetical protein